MIEQYAFIVDGYVKTFAELKTYGMFVTDITDTGAVSWNISTSANPYVDGEKVNNRIANGREITITFGYDLTTAPEVADAALFQFLSSALTSNGSKVTLRKISQGVTKYIDGVIAGVEHLAYTETPQLSITLKTDSYWRGSTVSVNLLGKCTKSGNYYMFNAFSVNNEVMADITYELEVDDNETALTNQEMTFYLYDYTQGGLPQLLPIDKCHMAGVKNLRIPVVEGMINNRIYKFYARYISNADGIRAETQADTYHISGLKTWFETVYTNITSKLLSPLTDPNNLTSELIRKLRNGTYDGTYCFKVTNGIETLLTTTYEGGFGPVPKATLYLKYTPLYIR